MKNTSIYAGYINLKPINGVIFPSYEQNQPKQFSDQSKIERLTGWSPKLSIEEGVKLTVNQWKNNIDSNF